MALASLIALPQLPQIVIHGIKQIMEATVNLQIELDKQRAAAEEERQVRENEEKDGKRGFDDYDDGDDDIDLEEEEEGGESFAELQQQAAAAYSDLKDDDAVSLDDGDLFGDDDFDDDDLDDDEEFSSPMDHFDELVAFIDAVHGNVVAVQAVSQLDASVQASFTHLVQLYPQRKIDLEKNRAELAQGKQ